MSAFLGAYIFLGKFKQFSILKILIAYFHRYYRLTPLLAVILYFSTYVIYPMTTGPYRQQIVQPDIENCKSYGWTVLLYINIYYSLDKLTCFGWTWYLANDMQMFLILPWVLVLYRASKLAGTIFIVLLFAANFACTFYLNFYYDAGAWSVIFNSNSNDFMKWMYIVPWVRITPYLMGICLAIWYYNYKQIKDHNAKLKKNPDLKMIKPPETGFGFKLFNFVENSAWMKWVLLLVGFGFTFYAVYGNYDFNKNLGQNWSKTGKAFYSGLDRFIFIAGLIMVLIPMFVGQLTWITVALSNSVFSAMAKVTYSVYLLHLVFIMVFAGS